MSRKRSRDEDEEPEEGGFERGQRRDKPPRRSREEEVAADSGRRNIERAGKSSRRQPLKDSPEGGIDMNPDTPDTGAATGGMISPEQAEKLKAQIGPQAPESVVEMAKRMAAMTEMKTPEQREAEKERARIAHEEKLARNSQTSEGLANMEEKTKLVFLRALQTFHALGRKPDRYQSEPERAELKRARGLVDTLQSWPPEAQRPYYKGFPGAEDKALRQGFDAWKQAEETRIRNERSVEIRRFFEDTTSLHRAMESGRGKVAFWVKYELKRKLGDQLVPIPDEYGKPRTGSGLIKIEVIGCGGYICDKLGEWRPPFIHPDREKRLVILSPEEGFVNERGQPYWHSVVREALVELWAKEERDIAQAEEREKVDDLTSRIEDQGTITVSELTEGFGGKGRKTGTVAINNLGLLVDPRDRGKGRFHLAFSMQVGAKGAAHVGEAWHSSEERVNLSPIVGRELVVSLRDDGFLDVRDPNLPSEEDGQEDRSAIVSAVGRVRGALRAQKAYEKREAEKTAATEAEEAKGAEEESPEP